MKLTVIGTGYLGATHAAAMVELGHEVLGLDIDQAKVDRLNAGDVPFVERGLPTLLRRGLASGRLRFTTSYDEVGEFGDVHFLCVGTPPNKTAFGSNLSFVDSAMRSLGAVLRPDSLVVGRSNVPSGTAARLAEPIEAAGSNLVWNPEFLRDGFAVQDTLHPDRIVIGADSERSAKLLCEIYAPLLDAGTPLIVTDFATAELVKAAASSSLATKISFINAMAAMADMCAATGADVAELVNGRTTLDEPHAVGWERDQIAATLALSEVSFTAAFDSAPVGIAVTSVENHSTGHFLRVNPAFSRMLGRSQKQIVGRPVIELTHPKDRHASKEPSTSAHGSQRLQKRYLHASGRSIWVELCYVLVRQPNGTPSYFITHAEDITTHKESARALFVAVAQHHAAVESLRELDQVRTEVVATMSHELRTPLTSISGYLEMLSDGDAGQLNTDQQKMITVASRNAGRLATLVDDLLNLSKLDATAPVEDSPSTEISDLGQVVFGAIEMVQPAITHRRQRLRLTMAEEPLVVRGEAVQLDRAVVNVLSNASKYTPDGGNISVSVTVDAGEVRVAVTDSGIGISAEEQEKVFDRFFRASTAEQRAIPGTGLGLAIVKSIVVRHGGRLSVMSEPGRGSTFTMTLPAADAVAASAAIATSAAIAATSAIATSAAIAASIPLSPALAG
jgi:PAS domain S-box-containing protein